MKAQNQIFILLFSAVLFQNCKAKQTLLSNEMSTEAIRETKVIQLPKSEGKVSENYKQDRLGGGADSSVFYSPVKRR